jgi:hypothetical protein
MHRSSSSIAAIASALAKAQATLVNPEKTMTATIRDDRQGQGAERSFRYAPLSTGLDVVRKALGQHELAVVQTTAIDESSRTVRLNTLLAHSSGEWIASDWPVCALSDINVPQRMGAALTYARRYGLFTLVGIAGEDDLDAPDLQASASNEKQSGPSGLVDGTSNSRRGETGSTGANLSRGRSALNLPMLDPKESAKLREAMLAEIASLASSIEAVTWARQMLRAKNSLTAADARLIENAFETKFAALSADYDAPAPASPGKTHDGMQSRQSAGDLTPSGDTINPGSKDRSLQIPKTQRHRNKEHLRFVTTQPCLVCGRQPSDPHHLRFAQPQALGRKVSDEFTVPLCRAHHREAHRALQELGWWQSLRIAPLAAAEALWRKSQSGQALAQPIVSATKAQQRRSRRVRVANGARQPLPKPIV